MFSLKFNLVFSFLFMSFLTFGQTKSLSVECSTDTLLFGNTIRVEYKMKNLNGQFIAPNFENFVVHGPSVSSQYQNINGEESSQKSYVYHLVPKQEGSFTIPAAEVIADGETHRSDDLEIFVKENPDGIIEEIPNTNNFFKEWSFDEPKLNSKIKENTETKNKRKRRKI